MLHGARWNSPERRVVYAAETYAGALLEILVHASGLSMEEIAQDGSDGPQPKATEG
jgi:RES domain-containing protein